MSDQDKATFNRYAIGTEAKFVARILGRDEEFKTGTFVPELKALFTLPKEQLETNELWKQIQKKGILAETIDVINDNANPDQIQRACEERYAWEFGSWVAEGYTKGRKPSNVIEIILNRVCRTLGLEINLIVNTSEHLKSDGWELVKFKEGENSPQKMFSQMRLNNPNFNPEGMYQQQTTRQQQRVV